MVSSYLVYPVMFSPKIRRFFSPLASSKLMTTALITICSIEGLINFSYIFVFQYITKAVEQGNSASFSWWIAMLIGVIILKFGIQFVAYRAATILIRDISIYTDTQNLHRFLALDNVLVERMGTGRMGSIFQKGAISWVGLLRDMLTVQITIAVAFIAAVVYIAMQGRLFGAITLVTCCVVIIWIKMFYKGGARHRIIVKETIGEIDRMLVRWIMSKFEILQLGRYAEEAKRDADLNTTRGHHQWRSKVGMIACYDGASTIVQILLAVAVAVVGYQVIAGSAQLSYLVLFISLLSLLGSMIRDLNTRAKYYADNRIHYSKLYNILYDDAHLMGQEHIGVACNVSAGSLELSDVSFDYGNGPVIQGFSHTFLVQKKTALVGPSGGGKTTIMKLISGYLQPTHGHVFVDGQDIAQVDTRSYFAHIGYLTQDPSIFDGTIRENLIYSFPGSTPPSDARLQQALQDAQCDYVFDLPSGLDTEIGERGIRLSGGQRQRLAIAKLFLKDPAIILLDEPTSALDSVNEQAVTQAFHNLFAGRTVIVIAHRLQTVKQADEILIIEGGSIVEKGTHDTLSVSGGTYQKMLELQSGFVQ